MSEPPVDKASELYPWKPWPWQCGAEYHQAQFYPGLFPYGWRVIEIWREGWEKPVVTVTNEIPPEFNVHGLWWRPWPLVHPPFDGP